MSLSHKPGETFDQFVTALRKLAVTCQFGNFEDEMLRGRIVTGIRDHRHRERLLRVTTLTLQKAIDNRRTNEMARDTRWSSQAAFTTHANRRNAAYARTHARILVQFRSAITEVTRMQLEIAQHMVKSAPSARRETI